MVRGGPLSLGDGGGMRKRRDVAQILHVHFLLGF
jgi:hypothetical protein